MSKPTPPLRYRRALMQSLESRRLLAAQVTSVYADNRGEVQITFNQPLDPATVNTRSVFVHLAGTDGAFGTAESHFAKFHKDVQTKRKVPLPFLMNG